MSSHYLPTALRRALEKTVKEARIVAEEGARDAIRRLVAESGAPVNIVAVPGGLGRSELAASSEATGLRTASIVADVRRS